jgi:hypothetical protein
MLGLTSSDHQPSNVRRHEPGSAEHFRFQSLTSLYLLKKVDSVHPQNFEKRTLDHFCQCEKSLWNSVFSAMAPHEFYSAIEENLSEHQHENASLTNGHLNHMSLSNRSKLCAQYISAKNMNLWQDSRCRPVPHFSTPSKARETSSPGILRHYVDNTSPQITLTFPKITGALPHPMRMQSILEVM